MEKQGRKKRKIVLCVIVCLLFLLGSVMAVYVNNGYEANAMASEAMVSSDTIIIEEIDGAIVFMPEEAESGLIFYPGGKVAHDAYAPLMRAYAEAGVACILLEMPFDLAVFDMNAADAYRYLYPDIEKWYVGGHSLGGAMAASYLENHTEEYEGLILCAAYSTVDYSTSELKVVSMYGSNDKVLNNEKYKECRSNLPNHTAEYIIEGGNHAYFGSYGEQEGDGTAAITNEEQIIETVQYTMENIK